jgi:hypothetical protein
MKPFLFSACVCGTLIAPRAAFAQMNPSDVHEHGAVACIESPTPGKRPPNAEREAFALAYKAYYERHAAMS